MKIMFLFRIPNDHVLFDIHFQTIEKILRQNNFKPFTNGLFQPPPVNGFVRN